MFDYSEQIQAFFKAKVRLSEKMIEKLVEHRISNETRLISRLPELKEGIRISKHSFKSQGSFAMKTIIQTKFSDEEYDIDDGLILFREDLIGNEGKDMAPAEAKELVRIALKDKRFKKQPITKMNCVRVFYAEDDKEKHHVDFPVYRKFEDDVGSDFVRELAGQDEWVKSNPTRVNVWFEEEIQRLNSGGKTAGTQLRVALRLLKRFCRSRVTWDMPNGMKLTMLTVECYKHCERIDKVFRNLLDSLNARLQDSLEVENYADTDTSRAKLTKTSSDSNMIELRDRISEALGKLEVLDNDECSKADARAAWDWVFKSDGFFKDYDNNEPGSGSKSGIEKGIAMHIPTKPVDTEGGGRYGT